MKRYSILVLTILLGSLPFCYWLYLHLNADLWYDEAYSLQHFVLVDFIKTVSDYHVPNNHVFFNLTTQFLSRIFHYRTAIDFVAHTWCFRLLQAAIAICTGIYCSNFIKQFFGGTNHHMVLIIIFTTLPFLNFSLQLRGYNLSSLLLVMAAYHTCAYLWQMSSLHGSIITLSSAVLIYTIPSNIYFLSAFFPVLLSLWLHNKNKDKALSNRALRAAMFISCGIAIAILADIPILTDILNNRFTNRQPSNAYYSLLLIPEYLKAVVSGRYILLPLVIAGIILLCKGDKKQQTVYGALLFAFFFPFIISFFHQKQPYDRVFIPLSPLFCILFTVPLLAVINKFKQPTVALFSILLIGLYTTATLYSEIKQHDEDVMTNLSENQELSQTISQNYFLSSFFQQEETMVHLKKLTGTKEVLLLNQLDEPSTELYLSAYNIRYRFIQSGADVDTAVGQNGNVYILTTMRERTVNDLHKTGSLKTTVITKDDNFSNIILAKKQIRITSYKYDNC